MSNRCCNLKMYKQSSERLTSVRSVILLSLLLMFCFSSTAVYAQNHMNSANGPGGGSAGNDYMSSSNGAANEYSGDPSGMTHANGNLMPASASANAQYQHQPTHPQATHHNYHTRDAGLSGASGGMISLLPVAFVAGFGLLLLIPLLFIFFSTGFGPSLGYGGYAGRKRSFDDLITPFVSQLHPMLANVAKNPFLTELWRGVDASTVLDSLHLLSKNSSTSGAQAKSSSGSNSSENSLTKSIVSLLTPLFKDILPNEWRRMLIHFAGRLTPSGERTTVEKGPHYKTN